MDTIFRYLLNFQKMNQNGGRVMNGRTNLFIWHLIVDTYYAIIIQCLHYFGVNFHNILL